MGIEPTLSAWEAEVLPLNYTRGALLTLIPRGIGKIVAQRCRAGQPSTANQR